MKNRAVVLVAEGNEEQFTLIQKNLQRGGLKYEIVRFCDGQELLNALNRLKTAKTVSRRPYLLFLDFQTPPMDGLEVLEAIKSEPQTRKLPIFALLAAGNEQFLEECYRHGCGLCLRKPRVYERFAEMIQRVADFLSIIELPELAALTGWEQSNDQRSCNSADC